MVIIGQPDARNDVAGLVSSLDELDAIFHLGMHGDEDRRVAIALGIGRREAGVFAGETSQPVQHKAHIRGRRTIGILGSYEHMVFALRLGFVLKLAATNRQAVGSAARVS